VLSLFRTNQFFANILLIFYIVLMRGGFLWTTEARLPIAQGIWSYEIFQKLQYHLPLLPYIATVIILIQAIALNHIVTKFRMSDEVTLFAGAFYILLTSSILELSNPTATLLACTFLLVILHELFNTYRQNVSAKTIFNVGLWIGIGSLFHVGFLIFSLLGVIGLYTLRSNSLKEALMILFGILTVYFLVGSSYYLFDAFDIFWQQQVEKNWSYFNIIAQNSWTTYIERIFFLLVLAIALLSQSKISFKQSIQTQKYQTILYWTMLLSGFTIFFQANIGMDQLSLLCAPLAIFLMYLFVRLDKTTAEALHLIWIFFIIAFQFHHTLGF
jgi:hypothetical protein